MDEPSVHNDTPMIDGYSLSNINIILPDRVLENARLIVKGGTITSLVAENDTSEKGKDQELDGSLAEFNGEGCYLALPLTELHIHGAFGLGFETSMDGSALKSVAARLEEKGVGRFLPTILWDRAAVKNLVAAIEDSGLYPVTIPGIYLEGPFVNPAKRGGIGLGQIHAPDTRLCEEILDICAGMLRIMTLAPEQPGVETLYPLLRKAGVMIALGHSDANVSTILPARPYSITHLFNAMSPLDHKAGGLVNIALDGHADWVEVNADGLHVNGSALRTAFRCVAPTSLILTSDAVAPAGLDFGEYSYFGQAVRSEKAGVRYSVNGTLIGSSSLGIDIVLAFQKATGCGIPQAFTLMSANPEALLEKTTPYSASRLEPGARADLFIWNGDFTACKRIGSSVADLDAAVSEGLISRKVKH